MKLHLECLPDECLVRTLGRPRKSLVHHNDKGRVCNFLKKSKGQLGMVDDDPGSAQPPYLKGLKLIDQKYQIKIFQDATLSNTVIVVCPRLEDWLIQVCRRNAINLGDYGLPNQPNALHREINGRLRQVEAVVKQLEAIKAPEILFLKSQLH